MIKPTPITVHWTDSRQPVARWIIDDEIDDLEGAPEITTRGYLVKETKKELFIALNIADQNDGTFHYMGVMVIPTCCITRRLKS